jgi:DNA repair protein RadA
MGGGRMSEFEEFGDPLLRIKGVSPQLAQALREAGYYTVESVAVEVPHFLVGRVGEKAGLTIEKAREIIGNAREMLPIKIMTVKELYEEELKRKRIPTGSKALDEILGGGISTHELTEVTGPAEAGKTELVYTTAVLAIKELNFPVWVIDTEAALNAHRIYEIAEARGLKPEEITSNMLFDRCLTSAELTLTLEKAHKIIKEHGIRYLAIDSFVSPFRRDYPGRELLSTRQQKINYGAGLLLKYCWAYEMAVLVTNPVMARPEALYTTKPEALNPPVGGHVMWHAANNRVYVMPSQTEKWKWLATLIASSYLPRGECSFHIGRRGIEDVQEEKPEEKR